MYVIFFEPVIIICPDLKIITVIFYILSLIFYNNVYPLNTVYPVYSCYDFSLS